MLLNKGADTNVWAGPGFSKFMVKAPGQLHGLLHLW